MMQINWDSLIRPKKLEIEESASAPFYGKLVCQPLERGFGITIGNALRRVLLASVHGAAIVSVKIDKVLHEFSTIPGVKEDVTDFILNLKGVRLKMNQGEVKHIYLNVSRGGMVTAGDITTDATVEIMNPDHFLCTLMDQATLKADLVVKLGRGYVPAKRERDPEQPEGTINIDANFSPVKKVNYTVTHARVGQIADYDRLTLEVWTDGSIKPEEAVAYAAQIMKNQFDVFLTSEEVDPVRPADAAPKENINDILIRTVEELELSVRAANCLKNAGIHRIGDLVRRTENEMLKTKNFGRKSLNEIKEILSEMGLSFGMKLDFSPWNEEEAGKSGQDQN